MKACWINIATGMAVNNCGSATCSLCLNRKRKTRTRKLCTAFSALQQCYKLVAITIQPSGLPTDSHLELKIKINALANVKKALVRKLTPVAYYWQMEVDSIKNYNEGLLAPHCHGTMALKPYGIYVNREEYIAIHNHTVQIKPIYKLKGWIGYTLKGVAHPRQLANKRIKLFSKSKGLW